MSQIQFQSLKVRLHDATKTCPVNGLVCVICDCCMLSQESWMISTFLWQHATVACRTNNLAYTAQFSCMSHAFVASFKRALTNCEDCGNLDAIALKKTTAHGIWQVSISANNHSEIGQTWLVESIKTCQVLLENVKQLSLCHVTKQSQSKPLYTE